MSWFKRRKRNSEDSQKFNPAIRYGTGLSKIHEDPEAAKARKRWASIAFLENWGWKPGFAWSSSWDAFVSCYKFPGYKTGVLFFYDDQQGWVLYPSGTDWHWEDEGEAHNVLHALVWDALKSRVEESNWSEDISGCNCTLRSEHENFNITMSSPSTLEEPTFYKVHKEVGWPRTEITIDEVLELTSSKELKELT